MITSILIVNAVLLFIYMTVWFAIARKRNRIDTVDTAWGLGFVTVAWATEIQAPSNRNLVIAALVSAWGVRLANHIWQRAKRKGEDPRYVEIAKKWKGSLWTRAYLSIFLTQGLLIWVVSLPIVMATSSTEPGLAYITILGALVWLYGFVIEAVADRQLSNFLQTKDHPKLMTTGLWRYSRHPNYFGELMQWWGIGVIALQTSYGLIGLIGPLVLTILIRFVSGVPPIERKRADDPEFQDYKKRTNAIILWPPKTK